MLNLKNIAFLILGLVLLASCKTEPDPFEPDFGYDYYPLELGNTWIYEVDSITYDPQNTANFDSVRLYVKETIADTLLDNNGNTLYRIEYFERSDEQSEWTIKNVYTAGIVNFQAQRTVDNRKFIKMPFPVEDPSRWDGNIFIDPSEEIEVAGERMEIFKGWEYRVEEIVEQSQVGDLTFDNVVQISNADSENLIELRRVNEQYSRGIGLIERVMYILDTQEIDPLLSWEVKAEKGFILKQRLIEWN